MSETINCHQGEPRYLNLPIEWKEREDKSHCSYCGSLHPEEVRKIIEEGGKLGGSDWKYGYPHKFYVYPKNGGMLKYYTQHLMDMEEPAFTEFAALLKEQTGIEFVKDGEGRLMYRAPYHGYQR